MDGVRCYPSIPKEKDGEMTFFESQLRLSSSNPSFNHNDITYKQLRISSMCWSVYGVSVIPPKSLQTDRITCLNQQDSIFLSFRFSVLSSVVTAGDLCSKYS